jgi:hypothetical protein
VIRKHSTLHELTSLLHPLAFVSVRMPTYAFASVLYVSLFTHLTDAEVRLTGTLYDGELI